MAKKKATKKKAAAVKVKATKPKKVEKTPAKKSSSKTTKAAATKPKAVKTDKKTVKPALMSKKVSKKPEVEVSKPVAAVEKKTSKNIVGIIESESAPTVEENAKVEKVSKVKPVKVDRGNLADEKAKWAELYKKYGKDKALSYKMTEEYPALVPLQHKVLGWGFILTNENSRLEVLFENGIRMLISNYKS